MRRWVRVWPAAALAVVVSAAHLAAQVDSRLTDRLEDALADSVGTEIRIARTAGLPTEPLVQRALEGASRGVDGVRIIAAVRALRLRLERASALLPATKEESALVAAAAALGAGVSEDDVQTVVAESRRWGPPVAPLVLVADLVGRGVAADSAVWAVRALGEAGVPTSAWSVLPLQLDQDIAGGASPSAAAATRVRGLILSRNPGPLQREPGGTPIARRSEALGRVSTQPGLSTFLAPGLDIPLGPDSGTKLWTGMVVGAGTSRSHLGGEAAATTRLGDLSLTLAASGTRGRDQPLDGGWSSRSLSLGALARGDNPEARHWVALEGALRDARWEGGQGSSGRGAVAAGLRTGRVRLSGRAFGVAGSTSHVFRRDTVFTAGEYRFVSRRSIQRIGDWAELGGELSLGLVLGPATVFGTAGQVWSDVPNMPTHRTVATLSATVPLPQGLELDAAAGWGGVDPLLGRTPGTFVTAGIRWTGSTRTPGLDIPSGTTGAAHPPSPRQHVTVEGSRDGWTLTLHGLDAVSVELMGDPTDWLPVPLEPSGDGRWRLELGPVEGVHRVLVRSDGGPWHAPAGVPLGSSDYDPPPGLVVLP